MNYLSVCSGIEAATVAWHTLGWTPAGFAEIEAFPSAVLAHHYPHVCNFGDMTRLADWLDCGFFDPPDILVGGTPCQAFSVAGLRRSLGDARGNLSLVYCQLADAIDSHRADLLLDPAVIVWENVPGVLSTHDNAFGCFLAGLAGEDDPLVPAGKKWSNAGVVYGPKRTVAWRILDAQYFGVAQRRRRVFVVASARTGFDPAAVLFEFDGLRRDSAPSREAGKGVAGAIAGGARKRGGFSYDDVPMTKWPAEVAATLNASFGDEQGLGDQHIKQGAPWFVPVTPFDTTQITSPQNGSRPKPGDPCHPLAAGAHAPAICFSAKDHGADAQQDLAPTLRAGGHTGSHANAGVMPAVAFQSSQSGVRIGDTHATLDANNGPRRLNGALVGMQVRRLTPRECERLQGFPDDYTAIPWRRGKLDALTTGDECPDGPRYKALGNSMAVPVMAWIGRRIARALA